MRIGRRGAGTLAAALAAACRSPEPALYTLQPIPALRPAPRAPRTVVVRQVSLARYLDRQSIVRSAEGYRLEVSENDWWGEPLDAMVTRVLVENLAQRLPGSTVFGSGGAISTPAEGVVEVDVQRLGLTDPTKLTLTAQVAVTLRQPRRREATRTETIAVPLDAGGDTRAFVAAASLAVGRLADSIAALLAG